ncbi:peptidylprolyl isomerase [Metabacillus niabensis]|uniref:peptidylprolyl isomerase n=1 Tax=Metabacillus niabensis TaxID=324854 RepID=UPI0039A3156E
MEKLISSKKTLGILAVLVVVAIAVFIFLSTKSDVVAKVGKESITKDDLYTYFVEQNGEAALDSLITKNIIEQEAEKQKVKITDKEIDEELKKTVDSVGGEEAFQSVLASNGISEDDLKENIKTNLQIEKLLESKIKITDEEMKTFFDENKAEFAKEEQVKAMHILVADEKTANEVKKKLDEGGDFAELAKEYSTDPGSAQKGGELGFFGKGQMVPEFEEKAFSMKVDEISDPVKTSLGYHIIKVTDRQEAEEANFEKSKEEIKDTLFQQKLQTEYPTWLEDKKENYDIKNYLTDDKKEESSTDESTDSAEKEDSSSSESTEKTDK